MATRGMVGAAMAYAFNAVSLVRSGVEWLEGWRRDSNDCPRQGLFRDGNLASSRDGVHCFSTMQKRLPSGSASTT